MNTKAAFKFQFRDGVRSVLLFYIIFLAAILLVNMVVGVSVNGNGSTAMSGMEMVSTIYLFVFGLNSFKEYFGFLVQNGTSRRSMFTGRAAAFGTIALGMAVVDALIAVVLRAIGFLVGNFTYSSLFEMIYDIHDVPAIFLQIMFSFTLYLAILMAGYFITIMFYRLNKAGKVAVGAGVPVLYFIVLPSVDYRFFGGRLSMGISNFLARVYGLANANPVHTALALLVTAALLGLFCWLMLRRAIVRK